jgi:transposase
MISDVLGASGRRRPRATIAGEANPYRLAALASHALAASRQTLGEVLQGRVTAHHRFMLRQHLQTIEHLEQMAAEFEAQIEAALQPFQAAIERLLTIPGISKTAAHVILAELGPDASCFPTAGHLLSQAELCPTLNESAGKLMSRRLRNGASSLKKLLVQCGWAAAHNKNNYVDAQFLRLPARRGLKKAVVAASILTISYHLLRDQTPYRDLGWWYSRALTGTHCTTPRPPNSRTRL